MKKETIEAETAQAVIVHSEMELNLAIENINKLSAESNVIDVQTSFTLTDNTTVVSQNMTLTSSNKSAINDGGFSVLSINNGAEVSLSMNAGGTGTVHINGDGANTTLVGLNGGVVNTVHLANDGNMIIGPGQEFVTGHINIDPISGAIISGSLDNKLVTHVEQGIISNRNEAGSPEAQMRDLDLCYQAYLNIAPGTRFNVASLTVQTQSSVNSDGTGTLVCPGTLLLTGDTQSYSSQGQICGVNVEANIVMENNGAFTSTTQHDGTPGGSAISVDNQSGIFDLGHAGTWNVGQYTQSGGQMTITIPDFTGNAPVLNINKNAHITGGVININAGIYYLPDNTTNQNIKLISAKGKLNIGDLANMVKFNSFPTGITPTVNQKGNDLYLVLTVG